MSRFGYVMVTYVALVGAVLALAFCRPAPLLIWNATASTPTGLYALRPVHSLRVGELVALNPPGDVAGYLARGGFLPRGVLLLKHVMARPGQTVCRSRDLVTIDRAPVGRARERDHLGRPLPRWSGCRTLAAGQVFLMNPTVPDSLDGRYFGPFPTSSIVARAVPVWTDPSGRGRFAWRAATS